MKILNNDQFLENINIIRSLIASNLDTKDVDINFCSADGETIFHYAVRTNNLYLLSWLINNFHISGSSEIKTDGTESEQIVGFNTKNSQGSSPLELALLNNQFKIAKLLLIKENQRLIGPDYQGTVLHLAILSGHYGIAAYLIEQSSFLNDLDSMGNTPIDLLLLKNQIEIAQLLITKAKRYLISQNYEGTALHLAIISRSLNIAKTIISINDYSALSLSDNFGNTPLELALLNNLFDIAKLLLIKENHGLIKADYQGTALHLAIMMDNFKIVSHLINHSNINLVDICGKSPLNLALSYKKPKIARLLIQSGADHKAMTGEKRLPLHYAALHGYYDIVRNLLDMKAEVDSKDCDETTALHKALCGNHLEIAQLLIARGADIKANALKYHMTTLHLAVKYEKQQRDIMVKYLLDNGLNINAQDKRGNTPLHHALLENRTHLAKLLIDRGADLAIKNQDGKTVRDLATEKNNTEILAILDAKKLESKRSPSRAAAETERATPAAVQEELNAESFTEMETERVTPTAVQEEQNPESFTEMETERVTPTAIQEEQNAESFTEMETERSLSFFSALSSSEDVEVNSLSFASARSSAEEQTEIIISTTIFQPSSNDKKEITKSSATAQLVSNRQNGSSKSSDKVESSSHNKKASTASSAAAQPVANRQNGSSKSSDKVESSSHNKKASTASSAAAQPVAKIQNSSPKSSAKVKTHNNATQPHAKNNKEKKNSFASQEAEKRVNSAQKWRCVIS